MKTQLLLIAVVVVAVFTISASPLTENKRTNTSEAEIKAPAVTDFAFFRTHRQGRGVTSTWGMTSESGVIGYIVQRTYEDPNDPYAFWEDICAMSCSGSRSYKFTDPNVSPGYITYRIVATMNGSTSIVSGYNTIHIVSH
jgi:hypothetical protein